jgi:hypothetical protein
MSTRPQASRLEPRTEKASERRSIDIRSIDIQGLCGGVGKAVARRADGYGFGEAVR